MMSRSGQVCAHSAPIAPAWNFCSKIVHTLATADINANGASAAKSRQRIRLVRHQMHRASTTGNMTTEGLLRVASIKKASDKANCQQHDPPHTPNDAKERPRSDLRYLSLKLSRLLACLAESPSAAAEPRVVIRGCFCHFKKQRMDNR